MSQILPHHLKMSSGFTTKPSTNRYRACQEMWTSTASSSPEDMTGASVSPSNRPPSSTSWLSLSSPKPVGAICHGLLVAARSTDPATRRPTLAAHTVTALLKSQELLAWHLTRLRLGDDGRTYPDRTVEDEIRATLSPAGRFARGSPSCATIRAIPAAALPSATETSSPPAGPVTPTPSPAPSPGSSTSSSEDRPSTKAHCRRPPRV